MSLTVGGVATRVGSGAFNFSLQALLTAAGVVTAPAAISAMSLYATVTTRVLGKVGIVSGAQPDAVLFDVIVPAGVAVDVPIDVNATGNPGQTFPSITITTYVAGSVYVAIVGEKPVTI